MYTLLESINDHLLEAIWRARQRNNLPPSSFAVPGKKKLPIRTASGRPDRAHIHAAKSYFNRTKGLTSEERKRALIRINAADRELS